MFIPRIYYPHPLKTGELITLDEATSHYLQHVLRLKNEESVILFNGDQGEYTAKFFMEKKKVIVNILSYQEVTRSSPLHIHLGQGLARGDRMDFVMQKSTELGVDSITPLFTKHCAVKLDEQRSSKRLQHWQNIAISAAEQSGRTNIPAISTPQTLTEWASLSFAGTSLIFDPQSTTRLKDLVPNTHIRIAVGPESGWDEHEVAFMEKQGFVICSLGPRILRTETAGITAISILQGLFGDL
ncbi:MAG: 16S rRNA (uracil(1498)-N(3))-methyltransferase [Gammaproteobacteria bacterium 39-13]|nr:16S rRNA (uracil(1498)-N(3))-methyltransferase [Gammaproteobacteria bacterium]OJV88951.1 MAG: 16S rRNA (uracil(1498)-N(3))-methyltransferase [Gammaproteobacteria bacterium 39-13]